MLKIQFKDRRKPAMWLVESSLNLGKSSICDIVIDDPELEDVHCALVIDPDEITLINLSKNKSIFVNDIPVIKDHVLVAWDIIRIGNAKLEIIDPLEQRNSAPEVGKTVIRPAVSAWMLKANSSPLVGRFYQVSHGSTIGRDDSADIMVPLSFVSRVHARLIIQNEKLIIEDAVSSNGTYVNDERIKSCELRNNDQLRLDEFSFTVVGPEVFSKKKPRTIIRDVKISDQKSKATVSKGKITQSFANKKIFLHDIDKNSTGKVYEIVRRKNHLSKMLGHHLSRSDESVSARHVHLNETDVGWEVSNNGASDGLLVNGKMQIRAILQDGDEITVGGTKLKFQSVGATPLSYFTPKHSNTPPKTAIVIAVLIAIAMLIFVLN